MTPVLKTGNAQAFFGSNPKPDATGGLSSALPPFIHVDC